jgi:hypothetical protein
MRVTLEGLVDDYLGETSELLPAWQASWDIACETMPDKTEALTLFLSPY